MTKDALEKLIESVADWSRAYQHALDQGPESEAVACEAELKSAKAALLAALAPDPNRPVTSNDPTEPGKYKLTIEVEIEPDAIDGLIVKYKHYPFGFRFLGKVQDVTGNWQKVEP